MANKSQLKIYFGTQMIDGNCVCCLTAAISKKRAAKVFNCSTFFREKFMDTLEIKNKEEITNDAYKLALEFPGKIFVKNCREDIEKYRLFIDENRYNSCSMLITDSNKKIKFLNNAISNKERFIKLRIKDEVVLKYGMEPDLYLDIRSNDSVKRLFFIPYSEKLIDNKWKHRAIETNHELSYILNEMGDVYNETITPYTKELALNFIKKINVAAENKSQQEIQ